MVGDFVINRKLGNFRLENWQDPSHPLWFATEEDGSYSLFQGSQTMAKGLDSVWIESQRSPDFSKVLIGADKKGGGSFISLNGEILFESEELEHAAAYFYADENVNMAVTGFIKITEGANETVNLFYLVPGAHGIIPDKLEDVTNVTISKDGIEVDVVKAGKKVKWIIRANLTGDPEVTQEQVEAA